MLENGSPCSSRCGSGKQPGCCWGSFIYPSASPSCLLHPAWTWSPAVIVTFTGWALTVKSLVYLLMPGALQSMFRRCELQARSFNLAGAALLLLGAVLAWECW